MNTCRYGAGAGEHPRWCLSFSLVNRCPDVIRDKLPSRRWPGCSQTATHTNSKAAGVQAPAATILSKLLMSLTQRRKKIRF